MFEQGDYVKVEFKDEATEEKEWMWIRVERSDEARQLVFGTLDNEPMVMTDLRLGMEFAVTYDNIREHMKAGSFRQ
jgi:uncharacterized protein YegJ (DUF2314 family)